MNTRQARSRRASRFQWGVRGVFVISATVVGLLQSCSQLEFQGFGYDYRKEAFVESIPDDSTRTYWLKMIRFWEAVDCSLAEKLQVLDVTEDRAIIDSLIEAFKVKMDYQTRPDTPDRNEWWEEMWGRRATHCDSLYCHAATRDYWDWRAAQTMKIGIPEEEYWNPGEIVCYHMHWWSQKITKCDCPWSCWMGEPSVQTKRQLAARAPLFHPFPDIKELIETALDVVSFPEHDSFAVWISSGIGVDQCVPDSGGFISYHLEAVVYAVGDTNRLLYSDQGSSITVPVPDTSKKALAELWYPAYLGNYRLPAGKYDMFISIFDDHAAGHRAVYKKALTLPSPQASVGMSDILIALKPAGKRYDGIANRIVRGNSTLMGNPAYYHRGDTLYPYLEFATDKFTPDRDGDYEYTMLASLYPVREGFKTTHAEIGAILEVSYDTVDDLTARRLMKKTPQRKDRTLIYSSTSTAHSENVVFQAPMTIPVGLAAGRYFLVISAQDAHSRKYLTAWREVRVRK